MKIRNRFLSRLKFEAELPSRVYNVYKSFAIQYIGFCFRVFKNRKFGILEKLVNNTANVRKVYLSLKQLFRISLQYHGVYNNLIREYTNVFQCLRYLGRLKSSMYSQQQMIQLYFKNMMSLQKKISNYQTQIASLTHQNLIEEKNYNSQIAALTQQNLVYANNMNALSHQNLILQSKVTLLTDVIKSNNYVVTLLKSSVVLPLVEVDETKLQEFFNQQEE